VTLLRLAKQPYYRVNDKTMGWGIRAQGGVAIHTITGDHRTILREPHVARVAAILSQAMLANGL
jgi:thioesterase domain-containing protein